MGGGRSGGTGAGGDIGRGGGQLGKKKYKTKGKRRFCEGGGRRRGAGGDIGRSEGQLANKREA